MKRQEQNLILRLWRDWCRYWPQHYGPDSLRLGADGYDPSFDLIPAQAYKDFYLEVVCDHPKLGHLNAFEVVDIALNQTRAPETSLLGRPPVIEPEEIQDSLLLVEVEESDVDVVDLEDTADYIEPFVVEVELHPVFDPRDPEQRQDIA